MPDAKSIATVTRKQQRKRIATRKSPHFWQSYGLIYFPSASVRRSSEITHHQHRDIARQSLVKDVASNASRVPEGASISPMNNGGGFLVSLLKISSPKPAPLIFFLKGNALPRMFSHEPAITTDDLDDVTMGSDSDGTATPKVVVGAILWMLYATKTLYAGTYCQ
jgi:hypothetical protein